MTDLRKAAQMVLETWDADDWFDADTLRATLAQPEQDLQLVANFLKEYGLEVLDVIAALKEQPEPEPVGWLYESRAGVRIFHPASDDKRFQADWEVAQQHPEAHKMTPLYTQSPQHLRSFAQDWDAPGMEAYDDPPLAPPEPTRSQQMRDAGYTRRPRQLPKEDEPEPVAWGCFRNGVLLDDLVSDEASVDYWCESDEPEMQRLVKRALYTHPPQRKPLTEEQIEYIAPVSFTWTWRDMVTFARLIEGEHGIGDKE
jgi:hypothetical protein